MTEFWLGARSAEYAVSDRVSLRGKSPHSFGDLYTARLRWPVAATGHLVHVAQIALLFLHFGEEFVGVVGAAAAVGGDGF